MISARSIFVSGFGLILVAMVAGCSGDGDTTVQTGGSISGISVTGSGRAVGVADLAILELGVDVEMTTVEEAREAAANAMQGVLSSLEENEIDETDIQTVQFSIQPQYDFSSDRAQSLRGYRVSNVVTAKIRVIETAGQVIDDAAKAGGDAVIIRRISFTIEDSAALEEEARESAVMEARHRAEQLAASSGVSLGKPLSIVEGLGSVAPQSFDARSTLADGGATPIQAGELEVVVSVQIVYTIDD